MAASSNKNSNTKPKISVVLLGKVGAGKSSTGNTLSGENHFDESNYTMSETVTQAKHSEKNVQDNTFIFYDTRGLMDANKNKTEHESIVETMKNLDELIQNCKSVSVFLLVYNFASKFSKEDEKTVNLLETAFGNELWKRCIIVITRGDVFDGDFNEWIAEQDKGFEKLLIQCNKRVVLMHNKKGSDEHEKSRQKLIQVILSLKNVTDEYTLANYKKYELQRNRFLLLDELEKTKLRQECDNKVDALHNQARLIKNQTDREKILIEIAVLRKYFQDKDKGTGLLEKYLDELEKEEENLPDASGACIIS